MKPLVKIRSILTSWWLNGKAHREDGPALEWPDGSGEWYLDGKRMSPEKHAEVVRTTKK